ncbi:MAG: hypothetical protein JNL28_00935 [Planctomycetes bacterium]|nr:hypothetical protein [Planctomycetota bacterium]
MRFPLYPLSCLALLAGPAQAQIAYDVRPDLPSVRGATPNSVALPPAPTVGSDNCATAEALGSAVGTFGFDLTSATTGVEGQTSFTGGDCNYGCAEYGTGNVQVPGDVWFSWVAPATQRVRISTCTVSVADAKLAVYAGPACPTGTAALACSDDYHGSGGVGAYARDATVYFDATLGTTYLIQVGRGFSLFAGSGFIGSFTLEVGPIPRPNTLDDGTGIVSFSFGTTVGTGNCRMQRFGNVGSTVTVTGAEVSWGWLNQLNLVNGTPCVVAIWKDANDDGNPNDGILLQQVATTMQNVGTDTFVTIPFSPSVVVSGSYFIGVASQLISTLERPLTADNGLCDVQPDAAWYGVNTGVAYDVTNIAANTVPATRFGVNCQAQGTASYNGLYHLAWTIRSKVSTGTPTTSFCSGDVVGTNCLNCVSPQAANNGAPGRGCANSTPGSLGGLLTATGVAGASAGTDTWVLTASDITGPGLFFQSTGTTLIQFGDGQLCAAIGIIRMGVVFPVAGIASYPGGLTPNPIHIAGATAMGDTRHYQVWYRDAGLFMGGPSSFCSVATYNLTQGLTVVWGP